MSRKLLCFLAIFLLGAATAPSAFAQENIGYISFDLVTPPGEAEFDIVNLTGPANDLPTTFDVLTAVSLSSLSLDVKFSSGPDEVFGSSYFTLAADGLSFNGTPKSTGIANPTGFDGAISATLTGDFSTTTMTLDNGSGSPGGTFTSAATFSATISGSGASGALSDGDFAVIVAEPGSVGPPPATPEPETLVMVGTGLVGLAGMRRRRYAELVRGLFSRKAVGSVAMLALAVAVVAAPVAARASVPSVRLSSWTSPSSGASGSSVVAVTGSGFPSGTINPSDVVVSLATSCGGTPTTTTATRVQDILGSTERVSFLIPGSLATGTYYVSIADNGANPFASGNCAEVQVTHTSTALAACLPSSSLAVLTGTPNVTAYVPFGSWGTGTTGIGVVPIEGGGTGAKILTSTEINSCSSNSQTGQTVCVDNSTDVFEITGSTINTTLTSGSNGTAGFSGGSCKNCGVAIDALSNTAVINMGVGGSPSGDGVQLLNLTSNTFSTPFASSFTVSENISVDPNRNYILSPDEDDYYDLFTISPTGTLTEYENYQGSGAGGEFDSAAEDCTTGIALSTEEFSNDLFIADLTQATFTAPSGGAPYGTWTAPSQHVNLYPTDDFTFAAGTSGISVAAGTTHLGLTSGEFGGNTFAAFQLPATSGSGTPAFVDWVGASLPSTPDGYPFSAGYDPHTLTAYTSPNNGKAYGLIADWVFGYPTYIAVIDLQALLNATRSTSDSHIVASSVNLVTSGIVTYVAVP